MSLKFDDLKKVISVTNCTIDKNSLIGHLTFVFNGNSFDCQFDSDSAGLYSFSVLDPKTFFASPRGDA